MKVQVHAFSPQDALEYGINEAILLSAIRFWVATNKANGRNEKHGVYWVYNSVKAWAKLFPYMSTKQINLALENLVEQGAIVKAKHSNNKFDRTCWYTILDESIFHQGQVDFPSEENVHLPSGENEYTVYTSINNNSICMAKNEFLPEPQTEENINDDSNNHSIYKTKNVLNDIPASPQPRSFKQWTEKEFGNEIAELFNQGEIKGITKQAARDFYDYWRELSPNGKMRFQLQKTWQTNLRLNTWVRRQFEGKPFGQQQAGNDSKPNHRILA